jgi:hypothetical protein
MSLSKRALARSGPRKHVRIEVEKVWPDIVEAREAGASLLAIFRQLKADGKKVGAGYSSFRNAVRYFDENPPATNGVKPLNQGIEDQSDAPPAKSSRDHFSDQRHPSDWG